MRFPQFSPFKLAVLLFLPNLALAQTPKAAQTTSPGPERVETTTYDSWVLTCREILGVSPKKTCSGLFRVTDQNRQPLLVWLIGLDKDGKLVSVFRIPTGLTLKNSKTGAVTTGLLVKKSVELKLAKADWRLPYDACQPQWCEASGQMNHALVKDAFMAKNAQLTFYAADGRAISYASLSIKGIDKVISNVGH